MAIPRMSLKETFSVKEPLRRFQQQFNDHPDAVLANRIRTRDTQTTRSEYRGCCQHSVRDKPRDGSAGDVNINSRSIRGYFIFFKLIFMGCWGQRAGWLTRARGGGFVLKSI